MNEHICNLRIETQQGEKVGLAAVLWAELNDYICLRCVHGLMESSELCFYEKQSGIRLRMVLDHIGIVAPLWEQTVSVEHGTLVGVLRARRKQNTCLAGG
jgi:hypothetical protein